jgi:hypothetical protein
MFSLPNQAPKEEGYLEYFYNKLTGLGSYFSPELSETT